MFTLRKVHSYGLVLQIALCYFLSYSIWLNDLYDRDFLLENTNKCLPHDHQILITQSVAFSWSLVVSTSDGHGMVNITDQLNTELSFIKIVTSFTFVVLYETESSNI